MWDRLRKLFSGRPAAAEAFPPRGERKITKEEKRDESVVEASIVVTCYRGICVFGLVEGTKVKPFQVKERRGGGSK